jgi:hypothetical protein
VAGDLIKLKELLDSGDYDVNALDEAGRTPLAAAFATCREYCIQFLTYMTKTDELHSR